MSKPCKSVFIILVMLNTGPVMAQTIGAGLGCSFTGYRDEVESPINRYGNALTYIIDGAIEQDNFFHSFNILFFTGNPRMTSPYRGYTHTSYTSYRGSLEYALDYRLWGNKTFSGYLGGAFRTIINYAEEYDSRWHNSNAMPTGGGLFSLDLHISQKWIINAKNVLVFSLGYPVFGYAVRPAYTVFNEPMHENPLKIVTFGEIVSFHNYWAVFGNLKYQYKFNKWFSCYSGFGFEFSRIDFPRPRNDAIFRLNTGLAVTFRGKK